MQNSQTQIAYKKPSTTKKQIEYKIFELKYGNTKLSNVQKYKQVSITYNFCFYLLILSWCYIVLSKLDVVTKEVRKQLPY